MSWFPAVFLIVLVVAVEALPVATHSAPAPAVVAVVEVTA